MMVVLLASPFGLAQDMPLIESSTSKVTQLCCLATSRWVLDRAIKAGVIEEDSGLCR